MSVSVLYDFLTYKNRVERVLIVHEDRYGTILPRVMDYMQKENCLWRHLPMKSLRKSLHLMYSNLIVSGTMLVKNRCGAKESSLWWHDGAAADQIRRDWLQARRVCVCPKLKDVV